VIKKKYFKTNKGVSGQSALFLPTMNREQTISEMNLLGGKRSPFFFVIDYQAENCWVGKPEDAFNAGILFNFNGRSNYPTKKDTIQRIDLKKQPVILSTYNKAFKQVVKQLQKGNSYLVNLTFSTPIEANVGLNEIFHAAKAKYRLLFNDQFVVFSPETFVSTKEDKIYTFPMKGTIDAALPDAGHQLLNNQKEMAEHATIVDLLRNDLSRVATQVTVDRFRYIDHIVTHKKGLLQVSSQISGLLAPGYHNNLGNIVFEMLPAGSISGAPKAKTLQIIAEAETHQRGFYTGIAGYFDGNNLDSCVLIRYIENKNGKLTYKSGGGITTQSIAINEYNEMIDKIYVPIA
jgi:para-aminobenzoate synthetase component I